jgi:hypothetical protein
VLYVPERRDKGWGMTYPVEIFCGKFAGKTAGVIVDGPSIARLTETSLEGLDLIMTINFASIKLRKLKITVPLFTMWKDPGKKDEFMLPICQKCTQDCIRPVPQAPELLLVHLIESRKCSPDYENRFIWDNNNYSLTWSIPSNCAAVSILKMMGVVRLKMFCFDARNGDYGESWDGETIVNKETPNDLNLANELLDRTLGVLKFNLVEWITP